jgi:hypothetical protein
MEYRRPSYNMWEGVKEAEVKISTRKLPYWDWTEKIQEGER